MLKRPAAIAAGSLLGLSILAIPVAAWADPPGCSHDTPSFSQSGGYMTSSSNGNCGTSETRTFRIEIKHDLNNRPDPVTAANENRSTSKNYGVSVSTCDHGTSASYYGRSFFTANANYHDSARVFVNTCT
ncbi:MAG TPA: hypothetical protein VGP31_19500 [Planosporangium sp.]|jgi:hypothetical protein|nr:hypothetical protein [Planosporangium sp.]